MQWKLAYFKIIVLLSLLFIIPSCKKEIAEEISIERYHIPQDITDYLIFKPGSYWVYEDSASGLKDSISFVMDTLYTVSHKSRDNSRSPLIYADYKKVSYYEEQMQKQFSFTINPGGNGNGLVDYTKYYITPFNIQFPFYAPFDINKPEIDYSSNYIPDTSRFTKKIPNLNINGNLFADVVEFRTTHLNMHGKNNYNTYHFYARHIGLIEFSDSTKDFKLIRYHLN